MKMDLRGEPGREDLVEPAKDFGFDTRSSTGGFIERSTFIWLLAEEESQLFTGNNLVRKTCGTIYEAVLVVQVWDDGGLN